MAERPNDWQDWELDIVRRYYPSEGPQVAKRLPNRTEASIKHAAFRCNVRMSRELRRKRRDAKYSDSTGDPLPHEIRERAEAIYRAALAASQGKDRLLRGGEEAS